MHPAWILAAIFMSTCGVIYAVADRTGRRQRRVYARLNELQWPQSLPEENPDGVAVASKPRDFLPFVNQTLERHGLGERLKWRLVQVGLSMRPGEFVLAVILAGALGFSLGAWLGDRLLGGLFAVFGVLAPPAAVSVLRTRRLAQFSDQLADALILIASSIRAGHSFLRAMQVVATELPDPSRQEFERAIREAEIGHPIPVALQNMVGRVPSYDLELAVTAVAIQHQVGGNLSEVLDTIAETIRERVRTRRQIAALTAEGKMSGWIAFAVPWFMFVWLYTANRPYMQPFITSFTGQLLLGGALVLQLMGGFWIWRILAVDL